MSTYSRPNLEAMTVEAIKQFCRDREITGYSRYTRKSDLIAYVESVLDSIDAFLEENLLEAPTEELEGDRAESSPDAIASTQIHPELSPVSPINPDPSQVSPTLDKTDLCLDSLVVPELSQSHPNGITGLSPGYPPVMPRVSCEYPANILGVCAGHDPDIPRSSLGHDRLINDLYPKSSHGFSSIFPGSRINPLPSSHDQGKGLMR
ncbi:Rho termination factor N-terminal domain-containing protein [Laspinema olomoucense]|uniref:Rho termination factor N-terminal domain-containing protein n=1 Tax=Laspinema olomoucense D3b TaxID=2953688 RepID=A0ABT2NDV5_9CYAN|nr:Rho termination factor N-terminal domain-containing protein [Laspinema sp. D3b]MCT7980872.1 Rho termination factor N-terminal domain-containing protein [Laspinema sp. D3b]